MHSNQYTLIYAAVLSVFTAVVLAVTAEGLRPAQEANVALDTKSNILRAVRLDLSDPSSIESTYDNQIEELVVNAQGEVLADVDIQRVALKDEIGKDATERKLPLYVFTAEDGATSSLCGVSDFGGLFGALCRLKRTLIPSMERPSTTRAKRPAWVLRFRRPFSKSAFKGRKS